MGMGQIFSSRSLQPKKDHLTTSRGSKNTGRYMAYSMHIVMLMASNIVKVLANERPIDGGNSQHMLMEPREITVMVWTN